MKCFTFFLSLISLLGLALSTPMVMPSSAIETVITKDPATTPTIATTAAAGCAECSRIYKTCLNNCRDPNGCTKFCLSQSCWSIVNGQTCSAMCLWYCKG
ncbi:hypothetical protein GQ44DRAFT_776501 [Phaeosphaeriaceae sp. PMI808]|nr:hypothetical protein GQ44DRAFT_776501 [Phaeosphaeriaceae sp. PMI808]